MEPSVTMQPSPHVSQMKIFIKKPATLCLLATWHELRDTR